VSEGMELPGAPRALRNQGRRSFGVWHAGCLTCESDNRAPKRRRAFWRNEPEGTIPPQHFAFDIALSASCADLIRASMMRRNVLPPYGKSISDASRHGLPDQVRQ